MRDILGMVAVAAGIAVLTLLAMALLAIGLRPTACICGGLIAGWFAIRRVRRWL